jgi:glycosyltransferase involved in cell wall biosynthesis
MGFTKEKRIDFSVVIPTYNRASYLRLAILSVLRQKGVHIEIIVSDDGSHDDTEHIVKSFKDKRIRYIKNKKRLGTALNFRQCFLRSNGRYIFTLGDDDFLLNESTLKDILKTMKLNALGMMKIGAFGYKDSPLIPYQMHSLGNKKIIIKPKHTTHILEKTINFGLGYFSGMTFDNAHLNRHLFRLDHACHADHMCPIERPAAYDLIQRYGIGYLPQHFVVGHLSLELIPRYFDLGKSGWFFMEKPIELTKKFISLEEYKMFKKAYLRSQLVLLPNIKLYTSYKNYKSVLAKMIYMDKTLLNDIRFIFFALMGLLPNLMIRGIRVFKIYSSQSTIRNEKIKWGYEKKVRTLLNDRRMRAVFL